MHVRDATPEDWPEIWAFMQPILEAGDTYSWPTDLTSAQAQAMWLQPPPARTLVAVDDGAVLGTTLVRPNLGGPGGHVANGGFMVDPRQRRRGVGRLLGESAIAVAREDGYRAMQFNAVASSNVRAVQLWQSLGFEIIGTVPEGFHHPEQGYVGLHVMHRVL